MRTKKARRRARAAKRCQLARQKPPARFSAEAPRKAAARFPRQRNAPHPSHTRPSQSLSTRHLSTDFSYFDSALRSIHGRCGRFADLIGKFGTQDSRSHPARRPASQPASAARTGKRPQKEAAKAHFPRANESPGKPAPPPWRTSPASRPEAGRETSRNGPKCTLPRQRPRLSAAPPALRG